MTRRISQPRLVLGLAAVLAGSVAVGLLGAGSDPSTTPAPTEITTVDGLPVMTVGEAIAARDAGTLPGGRVALRGFWSAPFAPSCPAPGEEVGELELWCIDGWFGITERAEPMVVTTRTSSTGTRFSRQDVEPHLTPWIPPGLGDADRLWLSAMDEFHPPFPVVVLGHFDDPLAADCRPEARQLCRDRLVLDRIVQLDGVTFAEPSPAPTVPEPDPTEVTEIDGLPVKTVSEALAAHKDGSLPDGRVLLRGFWTNGSVLHSCAPPDGSPGELEIYCHDGEYGITERNEPILVVDVRRGQVTYEAQGPHLTPWFPGELNRAEELFTLPFINGQWYPPVPIVVLGHFDDPRAADCRSDFQKLCRDRLVIDRIVEFDPGAVPTPGVTAPPTPFPSPGPPGLFEPKECAGDVPYSFVGWGTEDELGIERGIEGHIWAVISRDPLDRSGEWIEDHPSGIRYRHFGRVICFRAEYEDEVMNFESVAGTEEIHWEDGLITLGTAPLRPAST